MNSDDLLFQVSSSLDPAVVTAAAGKLDSRLLTQAHPRVFLPTSWVARQAKAPVALAGFALSYCNDPKALTEFHQSAKRVTTRKVIEANPAFVTKLPSTSTLDHLLAQVTSSTRPFNVHSVIKSASMHLSEPGAPDKIIRALVKARTTALAMYMSWTYDPSNKLFADATRFFSKVTVSFSELLEEAPSSQRASVASQLMRFIVVHDPLIPIDAALTSALVSSVRPTRTMFLRKDTSTPKASFTPEAVDLLAASPKFHFLLEGVTMTDEQFASALSTTPRPRRMNLTSLLHGSPVRLATLLSSTKKEIAGTQIEHVLRCLSGSDDPLFPSVISRLGYRDLESFVAGSWAPIFGVGFLPTPAQLRSLASTCAENIMVRLQTPSGRINELNKARSSVLRASVPADIAAFSEHLCALVDIIPGMAYQLKNDSEAAPYVFERLTSTGADPARAFDMFADHGATEPLEKIVRLLSVTSGPA